jgi:hypothetical protein
MNPFSNWNPRRPSPGVRRSLFGSGPGLPPTATPARTAPRWLSAGLVLTLSWSGTLMIWLQGAPLLSGDPSPWTRAELAALIAHNTVPVTSFAFTNAPLPPSTNASLSGPRPLGY